MRRGKIPEALQHDNVVFRSPDRDACLEARLVLEAAGIDADFIRRLEESQP